MNFLKDAEQVVNNDIFKIVFCSIANLCIVQIINEINLLCSLNKPGFSNYMHLDIVPTDMEEVWKSKIPRLGKQDIHLEFLNTGQIA